MSMNINGLGSMMNIPVVTTSWFKSHICKKKSTLRFSLLWDFNTLPLHLKVHSPTCSPHLAKKADCKAIRQSQSTSPILHQPIPPSKAPAISATSESGTRTYLPSGTNHFPIGLSAPALTASTANFFPATQKNIIAASIAPSGQI